jgi:hypothetical protein
VKVRDTISHEAHALANRLLGRLDMPRVVQTRALWDEANEAAAADLEEEPEPERPAEPAEPPAGPGPSC